MSAVVLKTNPGIGSNVLITDLGMFLEPGKPLDFDRDEVLVLQKSLNLRDLLTDEAFGPGSSTLILNGGHSDIVQANVLTFLDNARLYAKSPPADRTTPTPPMSGIGEGWDEDPLDPGDQE